MSTNFGLAGIPGTRLKVCVWGGGWWWWGGGGSHTHYCITPVPMLGAGALMLNAWNWTVTIYIYISCGKRETANFNYHQHIFKSQHNRVLVSVKFN